MLISAQSPFTSLIANLAGGADPAISNPVTIRRTYAIANIVQIGRGGPSTTPGYRTTPGQGTHLGMLVLLDGGAEASSVSVTVASNAFTGPTTLVLGAHTFTTGVDFEIGAADTDTATNLNAAINATAGFSSTLPAPTVVLIRGLVGPLGNAMEFRAIGTSPYCLTLQTATGRMRSAEPHITHATITS